MEAMTMKTHALMKPAPYLNASHQEDE